MKYNKETTTPYHKTGNKNQMIVTYGDVENCKNADGNKKGKSE